MPTIDHDNLASRTDTIQRKRPATLVGFGLGLGVAASIVAYVAFVGILPSQSSPSPQESSASADEVDLTYHSVEEPCNKIQWSSVAELADGSVEAFGRTEGTNDYLMAQCSVFSADSDELLAIVEISVTDTIESAADVFATNARYVAYNGAARPLDDWDDSAVVLDERATAVVVRSDNLVVRVQSYMQIAAWEKVPTRQDDDGTEKRLDYFFDFASDVVRQVERLH